MTWRRCWLPLTGLLVLMAASPAQAQRAAIEQAWTYAQQAADAYDAGDYATYRDRLMQAAALRPNHPDLVYNLAGAFARAGQPEEGLAWLGRYAALGLTATPADDDDLAALRSLDGFAEVEARLQAQAQPVGESTVAFRLQDPAFVPEGIAYDPATQAFFVGSVHQRRIVRVAAGGAVTPFAEAAQDHLWSVLGIAADAGRRRLWVTTAALAQTQDVDAADRGRSRVLELDLDSGRLVHTYPGSTDFGTVLGDLTVAPDGQVWVTDTRSGALYRIDPVAQAMELVLAPGRLVSPQGLCFFGEASLLVLADYSLGLVVVDRATRDVRVIPPPEDVTLLGIDGLACYRDRLLAIQNGVRPHRVVQLFLDPAAHAVTRTEVLQANHPLFQEPTLGVVVSDAFYYIANSQWNRFDAEGRLPEVATLEAPVVLRLALDAGPR